MRYMGDVVSDLLIQAGGTGPLDASVKGQALAYAPSISDARARDYLDIVDATSFGQKSKIVRIGVGAVAGLALGLFLGRRKKR